MENKFWKFVGSAHLAFFALLMTLLLQIFDTQSGVIGLTAIVSGISLWLWHQEQDMGGRFIIVMIIAIFVGAILVSTGAVQYPPSANAVGFSIMYGIAPVGLVELIIILLYRGINKKNK